MSSTAGVSRQESVVALLSIAAVWTAVASRNDWLLLRKRFWMDELCCTVYALRDASNPIELVRLVQQNDVAPPLLHLLLWPFVQLAGPHPAVLRGVTLACAIVAFWLLYCALRRRFPSLVSAGAIVGVASHGLLVHHTFEARFYVPWVMFASAYFWALGVDAGVASRRRDALLAIFAICLCAVHWFGVTSLFLLAAGAVAAHGRRWRDGLRLVAPSLAGPVVLLLMLPIMLAQLRSGGDALRWVQPLGMAHLRQMADLYFFRLPLGLAVAFLAIHRLLPPRFQRQDSRTGLRELVSDPSLAALCALVLMPVVLVVISLVIAPVMVPRYALVAVLAPAPVIALALQLFGRIGRIVVVAVFALLAAGIAGRELRSGRHFEGTLREYANEFREMRTRYPDIPLVFQSTPIVWAVDGMNRQASVAQLMDLSDSTIASLFPDSAQRDHRHQLTMYRDLDRLHERDFRFPRMRTLAALDSLPRFALVSRDLDLPVGYRNSLAFGNRLFPRHRAERISNTITIFDRGRDRSASGK